MTTSRQRSQWISSSTIRASLILALINIRSSERDVKIVLILAALVSPNSHMGRMREGFKLPHISIRTPKNLSLTHQVKRRWNSGLVELPRPPMFLLSSLSYTLAKSATALTLLLSQLETEKLIYHFQAWFSVIAAKRFGKMELTMASCSSTMSESQEIISSTSSQMWQKMDSSRLSLRTLITDSVSNLVPSALEEF